MMQSVLWGWMLFAGGFPGLVIEPVQHERQPEAISFFGNPLYPLGLSPGQKARLAADLAQAKTNYKQEKNLDNLIWVGRRKAYLGRYSAAIAVYSMGLMKFPNEPRILRHRGHRYITVRKLDMALADLRLAASLIEGQPDRVEEDGMPNRAGVPVSTLHTNIWYHLGVAYFLQGNFVQAAAAFKSCLAISPNQDMTVAAADWCFMALSRLDRHREAKQVLEPIHRGMRLLENHAYHQRLLMYKGLISPSKLLKVEEGEDADLMMATQGFGVAHFYLCRGKRRKARAVMRKVINTGYWPAFGYLAAEAELSRLQKGQ